LQNKAIATLNFHIKWENRFLLGHLAHFAKSTFANIAFFSRRER